MIPIISQSRRLLIKEIKSLEFRLADLQGRFSVIVNWIDSQYNEFLGLPEPVLIAIRGNGKIASTNTTKNARNINTRRRRKLKVHSQNNEAIKTTEILNVSSKKPELSNSTDSTPNEEIQRKNPFVRLDKLDLHDLKSATELNGITTHNSMQNVVTIPEKDKKCNSLIETCHENFNLRLDVENRKDSLSNIPVANSQSQCQILEINCSLETAIAVSEGNINKANNEKNVLTFPRLFDEESESGSNHVPFEDIDSYNGDAEINFANDDEIFNNIIIEDLSIDSDLQDEFNDVEVSKEYGPIYDELNDDTPEEQSQDESSSQSADYLINKLLSIEFPLQQVDIDVTENSEDYASEEKSDELEEKSVESESETEKESEIDSVMQKLLRNKIKVDESTFAQIMDSENEISLSCLVCFKEFPTPQQVKRHQFVVHLTKEQQIKLKKLRKSERKDKSVISCKICGTACKSLGALNLHTKIHLPSEVIIHVEGNRRPCYRCLKCRDVFPEKRKYISHVSNNCKNKESRKIERQDIRKDVICEICGFRCVSKSDLEVHMPLHTGEKNYLCSECGKSFARAQTLHIHQIASHSKEMQHKCRYCEKTFVMKYLCKIHEEKHTGASKVKCDICENTFADKFNLRQHMKGVHDNKRSYRCQMCDKCFKTSSALWHHGKTHDNQNRRKRDLINDSDHTYAATKRGNHHTKNASRIVVVRKEIPVVTLDSE